MDIKKEVKITFTQLHFFIIVIILAHLSIPFLLKSINLPSLNYYSSTLETNGREYHELELSPNDEAKLQLSGKISINNETIISPDIYILRVNNSSNNNISDLLSMLKYSKFDKVVSNHKKSDTPALKKSFLLRKNLPTKKNVLLNYEKILSKDEIIKIEKSNLLQQIKKLNPAFQKCYLRSLKTDELLTGKINIQLYSTKQNIIFQGIGKHKSIKNLKECVKSNLSSLKIPSILRRHKINFNVNLTGTN